MVDTARSKPLKIAQISDMHLQDEPHMLLKGVNPEARFLAALAEVEKQAVDILLLTGDLSHHSATAYKRLTGYLAELDFPTYWLPGNHDLTDEMARYDDVAVGNKLNKKVIVTPSWKIILLDSTSNPDGRGGGELSAAELNFLHTELTQNPSKQPILIALHHHPVSVESQWQDEIMLGNAEQFWQLLDQCPQVKGVLFGHVHQQWHLRRGNVELFSVPATAAQFKRATVSPEIETDPALLGPGFALYELDSSGEISVQCQQISG